MPDMTTPGGPFEGRNVDPQNYSQFGQESPFAAPPGPQFPAGPNPAAPIQSPRRTQAASTGPRIAPLPIILALVVGLLIGAAAGWGVFGSKNSGNTDQTAAAGTKSTAASATTTADAASSGSSGGIPPAATIPNTGTPGATAANAVNVPRRPTVNPAHDGATGLVGGPSFAPQDKLTVIDEPDLPFAFSLPTTWKCQPSSSPQFQGGWTCTDLTAGANAPGGILIVKQCPGSCSESDRAAVRNSATINPNLWRQTDPNTYFASLAKVIDGTQAVRQAMTYFFASHPGGPTDTAVVVQMQGPVGSWPDLQKVINEVRVRVAG